MEIIHSLSLEELKKKKKTMKNVVNLLPRHLSTS